MKAFKIDFKLFYLLGLFLLGCTAQQDNKDITVLEKDSIKEQSLEWFRDAKFGMFIHWGPYSQLAGEYGGRQVQLDRNAEWIMKELTIPVDEYRKLAHNLNPDKFNAREW